MKNKTIKIKRFQILYLPLIVSVASFLVIALISYNLAYKLMKDQLIENNIELIGFLSKSIQTELESNDQYANQITESLLNVGSFLLNQKDQMSNDYLNEMANIFRIDEIYYYQTNGEIKHSSNERYIGWTPTIGDPIYNFMESEQPVVIEDIRKSTETDEYYRFAYVRGKDGDFVQLGHRLETIEHLIPNQIIQSILERVINEDDYIVYSLVTDSKLVAIADTDTEDIGIDYFNDEEYQKALEGKTFSSDWHYSKLNETVIEVITPLVINDSISGIVVIGITQRALKIKALYMAFMIFSITGLVALNFLWVQRKNVIKPINQLCEDIDGINPEKPEKQFNYNEKTVFYGLYESVQNLLVRLQKSNEQVKVLHKEIIELAYYDYLTKLPNRFSFKQDFKQLASTYDKTAVVILDLNNFKEYNDMRGHSFGDEILISLGQRLNSIVDDNVKVSRHGGDEFMLGIGFNNKETLIDCINIIENLFTQPFKVNNELLMIEASMGVSVYPDDSSDLEDLTVFSDFAMYSVKDTEETIVAFYDVSMKNEKLRFAEIKKHLKEAIKSNGFKLLYQPIINVTNNAIDHYEALLRFKHHDIYPNEFIPIAESTGLIIPIGRYVLENAIKQIALWKSENHTCTRVSVNFSTKQFYDISIIEFIKEKLHQYGVSGDSLIIEITETFLYEKSNEEIRDFLNEFNKLGIEVAMDDFGTGYTSVLFFDQFPFNTIKLDKSFVEKNLKSSNKEAFQIWISLFRLYNYTVVAEGIETKEQFEQIRDFGIDFIQGFYISQPVSPDELKGFNFTIG